MGDEGRAFRILGCVPVGGTESELRWWAWGSLLGGRAKCGDVFVTRSCVWGAQTVTAVTGLRACVSAACVLSCDHGKNMAGSEPCL